MAPPWVVFDQIETYNGNCSNGSEPDLAGIGVVISFVVAALLATAASILAMLLDHAHNDKGHFTVRAPIKYIRERYFDTEWKRDYAWRPFLDPLIIGLGDQQLMTGYGLLLSGWIKVAQKSLVVSGAHFVFILYVCALSSSSHLAALITLRKYFRKYVLIARIRLALVLTFTLFLLTSMIAAISMPLTGQQQRIQRLAFVVPMFLMLLGFSTALVCILSQPKTGERATLTKRRSDFSGKSMLCLVKRITDSPSPRDSIIIPANLTLRLLYYLFLNPLIAFTVQIVLALLSIILVLTQKFARPDDEQKWCGLQDPGENVWGFGQTLSVVMLALPAMSACQTYLEGRQDILGDDRA